MAEPRLPMDVLIEVLILLPVMSILKFKCVSKTWRDLISSPFFIDKHMKCDRKQSVMLVKRMQNRGLNPQNGEYQLFPLHDKDFPELLVSTSLSIPVLDDLYIPSSYPSNVQIHGPCNGIVCIALGNNFLLCNPALREFKLLPPLKFPGGYSGQPLGFGFGFDQIGGGYKVIQIWQHEEPDILDLLLGSVENDINGNQVDLYDSASNSWKQIYAKVPYISNRHSAGVFTNGAIYWCAITALGYFPIPVILCFDTSSEAFRLLDVFDDLIPCIERRLRLMELDGSLAMVSWGCSMFEPINELEIWVMKQYGVQESCTKQFVMCTCVIYSPLLFLKNEWLVFVAMDGKLSTCKISGNQLKEFDIHGFDLTALVYEESLISVLDIVQFDCENQSLISV